MTLDEPRELLIEIIDDEPPNGGRSKATQQSACDARWLGRGVRRHFSTLPAGRSRTPSRIRSSIARESCSEDDPVAVSEYSRRDRPPRTAMGSLARPRRRRSRSSLARLVYRGPIQTRLPDRLSISLRIETPYASAPSWATASNT